MCTTEISFPGLGIDNFFVDRVAFNIGGNFPVYWYGIVITLGIVIAFMYACFRSKYENVETDKLIDVALWTVILGVVGARLYYVVTSLDRYIPEPFDLWQFIENVFNMREGGLAIYGGIIFGALGIVIGTKLKKINVLKLLDMAAPGVIIAQAMGRWGNFFNGEAFGGIVSEGHPLYFMRMGIVSGNSISDFGTLNMVYVHPTFLYESLWNIAGFVLLNIFYKKKKFNGQIACMYLAWYGFGRFFIEGLRTDSLYVGPFRISQVVGMVCFFVFGALLVAGLIYSKRLEGAGELAGFANLIKPSLVEKPVFFEKKEKKNAESEVDTATYATEAQDGKEESQDACEPESDGADTNGQSTETIDNNGEVDENGKDN